MFESLFAHFLQILIYVFFWCKYPCISVRIYLRIKLEGHSLCIGSQLEVTKKGFLKHCISIQFLKKNLKLKIVFYFLRLVLRRRVSTDVELQTARIMHRTWGFLLSVLKLFATALILTAELNLLMALLKHQGEENSVLQTSCHNGILLLITKLLAWLHLIKGLMIWNQH